MGSTREGDGPDAVATERTPLLPSSPSHPAPQARAIFANGSFHTTLDDSASSHSKDYTGSPPKKRRWCTFIVLILLCVVSLGILLIGFFAPAAAERYAREAVILNVTSISVESFTHDGMKVRVKADVKVDASRVNNGFVRNMGKVGTLAVRVISIEEGWLNVFLLDNKTTPLGKVKLPPMVVDVQDGHTNSYDIFTDVEPVSLETAKKLAEDYLDGNLHSVKLMGTTELNMRSGILPLGNQRLSETLEIEEIPSLPKYNITSLSFGEVNGAVGVNVSAVIPNTYPVKLKLPSLGFTVSIPGCNGDRIAFASANTPKYLVEPKTDINITVIGTIENLPDELTAECPRTDRSPLDNFLESYLHGSKGVVYVSGSGPHNGSDVPKWLEGFLESISIPAPVPGHKYDDMVESIGLSHVKFQLPKSGAEPGTPDAAPKLSAVVDAVVALPPEVKFPIDVQNFRGAANLSYHGDKFGEVYIQEWMPTRSLPTDDGKLSVQAEINQAPLNITDYEMFRTVVQRLVWGGGRGLVLGVDGLADVQMSTTLGTFTVRGIPAAGDVTIKALPSIPDFAPKATSIEVVSTTPRSITLCVGLAFDNPTEYSAHVPYVSLLLEKDGLVLGNASTVDASLKPGRNELVVTAVYAPVLGDAETKGLDLMGDYVSGKNTTLTIRPHPLSIPSLPDLSRALTPLALTLPIPRPPPPPPTDPTSPEPPPSSSPFLAGATMHVISSTATFLLHNPFPATPIQIMELQGEARYNGTKLGTVCYDNPWEVQGGGGVSVSPKVPVEWVLGGAAWRALKRAVGGELKVEAVGRVRVGIGMWGGKVGFVGGGLGVGVRL